MLLLQDFAEPLLSPPLASLIFPFLDFFSNDWQLLLQQERSHLGLPGLARGVTPPREGTHPTVSKQLGGIRTDKPSLRQKCSRGRAGSSDEDEPAFSHLGLSPFQAAYHAGLLFFSQLLSSPGIPPPLPQPSKTYGRELQTEKSCWPIRVIYKRHKLDSSRSSWIWKRLNIGSLPAACSEVRVPLMQRHCSLWVLLVTQVVVG